MGAPWRSPSPGLSPHSPIPHPTLTDVETEDLKSEGMLGSNSHAIHTVCSRHDKVLGHQGATTEVSSSLL